MLRQSKTYSGWCPFLGLPVPVSNGTTLMQIWSGRTVPLRPIQLRENLIWNTWSWRWSDIYPPPREWSPRRLQSCCRPPADAATWCAAFERCAPGSPGGPCRPPPPSGWPVPTGYPVAGTALRESEKGKMAWKMGHIRVIPHFLPQSQKRKIIALSLSNVLLKLFITPVISVIIVF